MTVTRIRTNSPDGALVAWELLAVLEDGSERFVGTIFEGDVDFSAMTLTTVDGDTFEVPLTR